MVVKETSKNALLMKVVEIYRCLDRRIKNSRQSAGTCSACGRCCDFDAFDHRLFVTPPEIMYLAAGISPEKIKPMTSGKCPYNESGKCTVYEYRFSGCRIFCCKGGKDFQSQVSESALAQLKSICTEFRIPYTYRDLKSALENFTA
jgi:hypothetical protein